MQNYSNLLEFKYQSIQLYMRYKNILTILYHTTLTTVKVLLFFMCYELSRNRHEFIHHQIILLDWKTSNNSYKNDQ